MGASGGMNDISFGFDGSKAQASMSNDHTPTGTFGKPLKQLDDDEMDTVTYQFSEATGLQRLDQPSIDSED